MSKAKIQVIDRDNIGIYADFGSESEDEHECDRQTIEKEDEEIRDFVKCHPILMNWRLNVPCAEVS